MKIVYVDPQSYGNLALYDYNLLKGIKGDIIYCCSNRYDAKYLKNVKYRKIFKYNNTQGTLRKGISYIISLISLIRILIKENPEVIHIQWWRQWNIDYLMLRIYKLFAKQIIYTAHNIVPHDTGDSMVEKCRLYYKRINKVIVHTERTKEELIKDFSVNPSKIHVIPHGILHFDCDQNKVEAIKKNLIEKFQLNNKVVIGSLGFQNYYKGTDIIQEMLNNFKELTQEDDFFFFIAGKGDIISSDNVPSKNVYVNNESISNEEFMAIMQLTDILLLTYRKISQSGVLLTALDNQIPYLATDVGGLCDPFKIENIGWRLDELSASSLHKKIITFRNKKNMISKIKSNFPVWKRINELYSWENISQKTLLVYKE